MGLEHLQNPPIYQGENANYCWAASLSWWLKAVRKYSYSMDDLIYTYTDWVNWEDEKAIGALTNSGMNKLLHDQRWHLFYDKKKNDKITIDYLNTLLKTRGPVLVAYYEPEVGGFHMNVIVAGAGFGDVASGLVVMDPNYKNFQIRNLNYYKKYYSTIVFAYSTQLGSTPVYGYG